MKRECDDLIFGIHCVRSMLTHLPNNHNSWQPVNQSTLKTSSKLRATSLVLHNVIWINIWIQYPTKSLPTQSIIKVWLGKCAENSLINPETHPLCNTLHVYQIDASKREVTYDISSSMYEVLKSHNQSLYRSKTRWFLSFPLRIPSLHLSLHF